MAFYQDLEAIDYFSVESAVVLRAVGCITTYTG
jgi:hypothetical protein